MKDVLLDAVKDLTDLRILIAQGKNSEADRLAKSLQGRIVVRLNKSETKK